MRNGDDRRHGNRRAHLRRPPLGRARHPVYRSPMGRCRDLPDSPIAHRTDHERPIRLPLDRHHIARLQRQHRRRQRKVQPILAPTHGAQQGLGHRPRIGRIEHQPRFRPRIALAPGRHRQRRRRLVVAIPVGITQRQPPGPLGPVPALARNDGPLARRKLVPRQLAHRPRVASPPDDPRLPVAHRQPQRFDQPGRCLAQTGHRLDPQPMHQRHARIDFLHRHAELISHGGQKLLGTRRAQPPVFSPNRSSTISSQSPTGSFGSC